MVQKLVLQFNAFGAAKQIGPEIGFPVQCFPGLHTNWCGNQFLTKLLVACFNMGGVCERVCFGLPLTNGETRTLAACKLEQTRSLGLGIQTWNYARGTSSAACSIWVFCHRNPKLHKNFSPQASDTGHCIIFRTVSHLIHMNLFSVTLIRKGKPLPCCHNATEPFCTDTRSPKSSSSSPDSWRWSLLPHQTRCRHSKPLQTTRADTHPIAAGEDHANLACMPDKIPQT